MAGMEENLQRTAGIVGAGSGGSGLLRFLLHTKKFRVVFVADSNPEAPGMKLAGEHGIAVFPNVEEAFARVRCDTIFEMTGVPAVKARILELMQGSAVELMPNSAWMLVQELELAKQEAAGKVVQEILAVKERLTSGLEGSQNLVGRINHIMSSMQMLALNASIEAAKVGVHGRGFAVVADHMTKSVENVRKLTEDIGKVNNDIQLVSGQINTALAHLE